MTIAGERCKVKRDFCFFIFKLRIIRMRSYTKGNDPIERKNSMKGGMKEMHEQSL